MSINEQLAQFNAFAHELAQQMGGDLTIDEVYDKWWNDHHQTEDLAALKEAHSEYEQGERGRPAAEVLADLQRAKNLNGSSSETEP